MMIKLLTPMVAIIAITIIELYAISKGIDGIALTTSIAAISGIVGFHLKKHFFKE